MTTKQVLEQWYLTSSPNLLAEDMEWELADDFLGGGKVVGREAAMKDVFGRIGTQFHPWRAIVSDYIEAGDTIVVLGHYQGTARQTGRDITAQFAHVWRVANDEIVFGRQYTNTAAVNRALG